MVKHKINESVPPAAILNILESEPSTLLGLCRDCMAAGRADDERSGRFMVSLFRLSSGVEEALAYILWKLYGYGKKRLQKYNGRELCAVYAAVAGDEETEEALHFLRTTRNLAAHAVLPAVYVKSVIGPESAARTIENLQRVAEACGRIFADMEKSVVRENREKTSEKVEGGRGEKRPKCSYFRQNRRT